MKSDLINQAEILVLSGLNRKMFRNVFSLILVIGIFIILILISTACQTPSSDNSESETTPGTQDTIVPSVIHTYPSSDSSFIPAQSSITVFFSENMSSSSLNTTTFTLVDSSSNQIIGSVSVTDEKSVFNPTTDLSHDVSYTATINTGAKDTAGNSLTTNYTWDFKTTPEIDLVAGGGWHTLELKSDGTVFAHGMGSSGQLGNNNTEDSALPVQVVGPGGSGFLTDIVNVTAGDEHSMALKSDGTVWAWGSASDGELGTGSNTDISVPAQVVGPEGVGFLTDVVAIAADYYQSIALKNDGTVWAWGENGNYIYGNDTSQASNTPVQTCDKGETSPCQNFISGVTAISLSSYRTLALKSDGSVWSWGEITYGGLGIGTWNSQRVPGQVCANFDSGTSSCLSYLTDVIAIDTGLYGSTVAKSDGSVWTWGSNYYGALGIGSSDTSNRLIPVRVCETGGSDPCSSFLSNVIAVETGYGPSAALKSDGTVWMWGYNYSGGLGDGTLTDRLAPIQVSGLTDVKSIALNDYYTSYAVTSSNSVYGWGYNNYGELGVRTTTECDNRNINCSKVPIINTPVSGQLDPAYTDKGYALGTNPAGNRGDDVGRALFIDNSGRILVTGYSDSALSTDINNDMTIWRLNQNGTLDSSFNSNGIVTHEGAAGASGNDRGMAIITDASDNILIAGRSFNGSDFDMVIWRFKEDGSLDTSFNLNGYVVYDRGFGDDYASAIQVSSDGSGSVVVVGLTTNNATNTAIYQDLTVWRFTSDGTTDVTFGGGDGVVIYNGPATGGGFDTANDFIFDGTNIIVAGSRDTDAANQDMVILRLDATGDYDTAFGTGGMVVHDNAAGGNGNDYATSVLIDASGDYLIAGYSERSAGNYDLAMWKYDTSGNPVNTFGTNGIVTHDNAAGGTSGSDFGFSADFDNSGDILITGKSHNGTNDDMVVWRYTPDGILDTSFNGTGYIVFYSGDNSSYTITDVGWVVLGDSQGRIHVAGEKFYRGWYNLDMAHWKILP